MDRIRHKTREGTFVVAAKVTLDEWLDEWLRAATIDVEAATAANYRDALRPARLRLGSRVLQKLTENDIDELVSWMLTEGRIRGGTPAPGSGCGRSSWHEVRAAQRDLAQGYAAAIEAAAEPGSRTLRRLIVFRRTRCAE